MIKEVSEVLMYAGGFVLAIYPIAIALLVDLLILIALFKTGGSDHPFITGMLFGFILSSKSSHTYDSTSSYLALGILAPINAGLAILLCLYLGMPMLAWIVGLVPVGALIILGAGALLSHFKPGIDQATQAIRNSALTLFNYLKERQFTLGVAVLLAASIIISTSLLFHFSLPLYAYYVGFASIGMLAILGFVCLAQYIYKFATQKQALIQKNSLSTIPISYSDNNKHLYFNPTLADALSLPDAAPCPKTTPIPASASVSSSILHPDNSETMQPEASLTSAPGS